METLLLIDANSLIHRCFHALPPLTTPDKRPIQAIYGLANILLRLWREEKPDYAAALFDRPEPTFRKERYKEYKAHRPKTPDTLIPQIEEAHNLFSQFGIQTYEKAGFEADDLIATFAEKFAKEKEAKVVILTGDLDALQLVRGNNVVVRTFKKGISETRVYDEEEVKKRFGLKPSQLIDYKALVGDPSDNIKGVPGIGPKTAASLLARYGTIENLYNHLGEQPKLEHKLREFQEQIKLAGELVILNKDAPLVLGQKDELRVVQSKANLLAYFQKLGFQTLVKRLYNGERGDNSMQVGEKKPEHTLFSSEDSASVLFLEDVSRPVPEDEYVSEKTKVGFGLKELLKERWKEKRDIAPPYYDLGIAFWLLNPDFKRYDPISVGKQFLKKDWRGDAHDYALAYAESKKKLEEFGMLDVFQSIEMPLVRILAEMECWGMAVNGKRIQELRHKIEDRLAIITKEIYQLAGQDFNLNSPRQVGAVLFEKLGIRKKGLTVRKTTGGHYATGLDNLALLKGEHPIVQRILEYRESFKILSTYVKPFQELVGADDRLRTDFIQTGTATGRLSSHAPNLQNIPRESPWAAELRSAFEAPPGTALLSADYSQIELRILAAVSGDKNMKMAFEKHLDIHRVTAAKIFDVAFQSVTPEMRRLAKTLNFGLMYGMGIGAFARTSGIGTKEAQKFINAYFDEFSQVKAWQEHVLKEARGRGYVQTATGRRRYLPGILSSAPQEVSEAERSAINQPIQGLDADINKRAMIKTKEALKRNGWWGEKVKMVLAIHDELLFEVSDSIIKEVGTLIKETMEHAYPLAIPLEIDLTFGKDWGHLQEIHNP